jgi:GNAT superfamily N-acetyltransferase
MRISGRRLPALLSVLVIAFADQERFGVYSAIQLFRGFAVQLAYRWTLGTVIATPDDRSVLLWSPATAHDRTLRPARRMCAVLAAVLVGAGLFFLSNLMLFGPLDWSLRHLGLAPGSVRLLHMWLLAARFALALRYAWVAYAHDARFLASLPAATGLRWRLDYMAAVPSGRGHGSHVLAEFLQLADEHGAEVALNCHPQLVAFYRRRGFRETDSPVPGQALMVRAPHNRSVVRRLHKVRAA